MQPRTKDRIAKALGYVLGGVVGLVLVAYFFYKIWLVVSLL